MDLIELCLKLPEPLELNFELFAHLSKLIFDNCEDIGSARGRSCRTSLTRVAGRPTLAPPAPVAGGPTLAALSGFALCPHSPDIWNQDSRSRQALSCCQRGQASRRRGSRRGPLHPDWLTPLRSLFAARSAVFALTSTYAGSCLREAVQNRNTLVRRLLLDPHAGALPGNPVETPA